MAGIRSEDGKKWINAFVAIISIVVGFVVIRFFEQLGEWFELEAKVKYYLAVSQIGGVLIGLTTFIGIFKHKNASKHLNEVYTELTKVVWPTKDIVIKLTIGIIIGVSIISLAFVAVDFGFQKILDLIY